MPPSCGNEAVNGEQKINCITDLAHVEILLNATIKVTFFPRTERNATYLLSFRIFGVVAAIQLSRTPPQHGLKRLQGVDNSDSPLDTSILAFNLGHVLIDVVGRAGSEATFSNVTLNDIFFMYAEGELQLDNKRFAQAFLSVCRLFLNTFFLY